MAITEGSDATTMGLINSRVDEAVDTCSENINSHINSHINYPLEKFRHSIPALNVSLKIDSGHKSDRCLSTSVFLNGPGGTQVPACVPAAMREYLLKTNSNVGAPFAESIQTECLVAEARSAMAAFFNAEYPEEIFFGQNMSSVTFLLSDLLSQTWQAGDQIILSELDHDSNIKPWVFAARKRGVEVKYWPVNLCTMSLDFEDLLPMITSKTKLISVTMASNLLGSMVDVSELKALLKKSYENLNIQIFIDATHASAHMPVDVRKIDCDFLACSAYKFSGPHLGVLYVKKNIQKDLKDFLYKNFNSVSNGSNSEFSLELNLETGTLNFEALAGLLAILKYKGSMFSTVEKALTTESLHRTMTAIFNYERDLIKLFLKGLSSQVLKNFTCLGWVDLNHPKTLCSRTPTFALMHKKFQSDQLARYFSSRGLLTASGQFHCSLLAKKLGLENSEGVWRIGFAYYTSKEEIEKLLNVMADISR